MSDRSAPPLVRVEGLKVHFPAGRGHGRGAKVRAVDGIDFEIAGGRTFGIVGESGSGKSTTAFAVMRLVDITQGRVLIDGQDLTVLAGEALRQFRRNLQIIFQDPFSSLDPRRRIGDIVREPLDRLRIGTPVERRRRVDELLARVGLRPEQSALFPHQFSGGQRQRVCIARALASRPRLVICDEPVSALDVAIQAQILNLLNDLQKEFGLTYLFISHDLGVVQYMCDRVAVMYLGTIVERADRRRLFDHPLHPYTIALLSAVPTIEALGQGARAVRHHLKGDPPSPINPPSGCRFHGRCPFAQQVCRAEPPPLRPVAPGHHVACHRVAPDGTRLYDPAEWSL